MFRPLTPWHCLSHPCSLWASPKSPPARPKPRPSPTFLNQGWTASERDWFLYCKPGFADDDLFLVMAIERADDDKPFRDELPSFA